MWEGGLEPLRLCGATEDLEMPKTYCMALDSSDEGKEPWNADDNCRRDGTETTKYSSFLLQIATNPYGCFYN